VPTLFDLSGVPRPEGVHGESLLPLLRGEEVRPREFAFATSTVVGGHAVIDERFCFESVDFSSATPALASSWFGIDRPTREELEDMRSEVREVLHDRRMDPRLGHLGLRAIDSADRDRLRAAGEEWSRIVEHASILVHDPEGQFVRLKPEEIEELYRRHMISGSAAERGGGP
jgi:hypothetical protein